MKKTALLAALMASCSGATLAETITGGLTLSYTQHSQGSADIDTAGLDGRLAIDMDNGLTFGIDLGHSTMSQSGTPFDMTAEFYSIEAGYRFGGGFHAGVFADRLTMGIDLAPTDFTLKTNGVMAGYDGSGYELEAFVGKTTLSVPVFPPSVDITNYGISGHYTGMEGLDVGAAFSRARLSDGTNSESIDFAGVAATYMVNDSVMVFAGASQLDFFSSDSIDAYGLGVSYNLGAQMGFASSVSFEYGQVSMMGSDNVDVIRLGLTIPLGKSGPVLPMNSVADAVLNARHGAFNAGMTSAF